MPDPRLFGKFGVHRGHIVAGAVGDVSFCDVYAANLNSLELAVV